MIFVYRYHLSQAIPFKPFEPTWIAIRNHYKSTLKDCKLKIVTKIARKKLSDTPDAIDLPDARQRPAMGPRHTAASHQCNFVCCRTDSPSHTVARSTCMVHDRAALCQASSMLKHRLESYQ